MNYRQWGQEYLEEAEQIKGKVDQLRELLRDDEAIQDRNLIYRINMLYSMYLDCRRTGKFLQEYRAEGDGAL